MSSTLVVKRGFGGGKAFTKFMTDHVDELSATTKIPVSTKTHAYIYLDPDEMESDSAESFRKLLFERFAKAGNIEKNPHNTDELRNVMGKVIRDVEIVFIIRGINYLQNIDASVWGNIASLWLHSGRVHFLFVLYEGGPVDINESRFDRIREVLAQNVVRLEELSSKDIDYVIDRMGYTTEYDFSKEEREDIAKMSRGYPSLLKTCCLAVSKGCPSADLEEHTSVQAALLKIPAYQDQKESFLFTEGELAVWALFKKNPETVISKDKIADTLWEDPVDQYSESAIVQVIRRIRKKIAADETIAGTINAVYGKGYVYRGSDPATQSSDPARTPS